MAVPRRKDKERNGKKSNDVKSLLHTAQKKVAYQLGAGVVSGDVVVAIEFQLVEGGGNAEPAGHGGGLEAGDAGFADDHYISTAHGAADQDYFQFDDGIERQFARAEEEDSGGADVARDQSNREIFGAASYAAEAQGQAQGRSGIFALLWKNADGVGWHACEAAHRVYWL
jgi:hypothetical protein